MEFNANAEHIPIHIGGPVHSNELFVLHGPPLDWEDSLKITDDLALSNSRSILEAIASGKGAGFLSYFSRMRGLGTRSIGVGNGAECLVDEPVCFGHHLQNSH